MACLGAEGTLAGSGLRGASLLEEDDAGLAIGVVRLFNNNREGMMRKVVGVVRANGRPYVFGDDGAVFFLSDDGVEWRSAPSVPGTEMDAEAKQRKSFIEDMEAHEAAIKFPKP